jgi:hypothetical protein
MLGSAPTAATKQKELAAFLAMAQDRRIEPGSWPVVENIDRLSRKGPRQVLTLLWQIIDLGVNVQAGAPYTPENADELGPLVNVIAGAATGKPESDKKSECLKARHATNRAQSYKEGAKIPSRGPLWLKRVNDGWIPIPLAVYTIQKLFELYVGGRGIQDIVRILNEDKNLWHPNGRWKKDYADKTLKDRRLLGERQWHHKVNGKSQSIGEPVKKYFPVCIDPDLFHRAQDARAVRADFPDHGGGKSGENNNLFRRIARCALCGERMRFSDKGTGRYPYLRCPQACDGGKCRNRKTIRYDKLEPILLYHTRGLDARALLFDDSQKDIAKARRDAIAGELVGINKEVKNLRRSIARTDDDAQAQELEDELTAVLARRTVREQKLLEIVVQPDPQQVAEHLASVEDLIVRMEELSGAERSSLRYRLRSHLERLVEPIAIEVGRHRSWVHITFRHSGTLSLLLDAECAVLASRTTTADGQFLY